MTIDANKRKISKRGLTIRGVVVSDRAKKTVIVQRDLVVYITKYKRYARKISKIAAHNPDEIGAGVGDVVDIAECRKISKTKAWIVDKIVQKGKGHLVPGQVKAHDEAQRTKHAHEEEEEIRQEDRAPKEENKV